MPEDKNGSMGPQIFVALITAIGAIAASFIAAYVSKMDFNPAHQGIEGKMQQKQKEIATKDRHIEILGRFLGHWSTKTPAGPTILTQT